MDGISGAKLKTIEGFRVRPNALHFSADGTTLVTADEVDGVKIWDVETGKLLRKIDIVLQSLAISPDKKWLATGTVTGSFPPGQYIVRLWEISSGKMLHELKNVCG